MRWRSKRGFSVFVGLILLLLFLIFLLVRSNIFTIKTVEINSKNLICTDSNQIKITANLLGQNFFLVKKDSTEKKLKENFICVKGINLDKFFPNRVKLEVFSREAIAILANLKEEATKSASPENIATPSAQLADSTYLIDNEGVIFAKSLEQSNLPKIYLYDPNLYLGKKKDLGILRILEKTKTFRLNVILARVNNNFLILYPNESPKIIFRVGENIDIQIASLQLILEKAKIDSDQLEFIDLRFDKPVIKIAPKKNG